MPLVTENPYEAPVDSDTESTITSRGRSPRVVLYAQRVVALIAVMSGVSETNLQLNWAQFLIPAAPLVMLSTIVFPLLVLVWCFREKLSPLTVLWSIVASIALSTVSFYGLLPLFQ